MLLLVAVAVAVAEKVPVVVDGVPSAFKIVITAAVVASDSAYC